MCSAINQLKLVLIGLTILFCLGACTPPRPGNVPSTLKIGLVAPFEGLYRPLGYEVLFGVKLALQERNLKGGLHGYQIELVALNDFSDPAEAQIQAQVLVTDPDVMGVVGHLSSMATLAAKPVYQEANLALSIPWTTAVPDADSSSNGVVSLAASYSETSAQLKTISQNLGLSNMVEMVDSHITHLPVGTQALQITTDGVTAGQIILALRQADITLPLFGQVEVGSPQVIQVAESVANGLIFVSPAPDPKDVAKADSFIEAYQALAGFPPGPRAVLAYDATQVLLEAIEQAIDQNNGPPSRAEVSAALTKVHHHGLSGEITFDSHGRRINAPIWVYQISKEEYPGYLLSRPD